MRKSEFEGRLFTPYYYGLIYISLIIRYLLVFRGLRCPFYSLFGDVNPVQVVVRPWFWQTNNIASSELRCQISMSIGSTKQLRA